MCCGVFVTWSNAVISNAHDDVPRHGGKTINVKGFGDGCYKNGR